MDNALMVIFPYKRGVWMFDDAATGLQGEPFVGEINLMIDALCTNIPNAEDGIMITFSANNFPGAQICLNKTIANDMGGNWYKVKSCDVEQAIGIEGWLCPALFKYFSEAPDEIYCKVDPKQ